MDKIMCMPIVERLLRRSRIDAILREAINCSLVNVVAAKGFGKTYAAVSFLQELDHKMAWLAVEWQCDSQNQFWDAFVHSLMAELPETARELMNIQFPGTKITFDFF